MSNTRFGEYSLQEIDGQIQESVPINTIKTHNSIWNQFSEFCTVRGYNLDESTTVEQIATILKDWAFNMKKRNGEEYKEGVIKTSWNITAKKLQVMFFEKYSMVFDPFTDVTFKSARDARNAKRRNLQLLPSKRKTSAVALTDEEHQAIIKLWDESTPSGLQRKLYHIIAVELAWRGGEAAKCLVQHFQEELDNKGKPTGDKYIIIKKFNCTSNVFLLFR